MNAIKPLRETPDTVTLSRADFDALLEEMEDAADRVIVLEDCLLDMKPDQVRYLLTLTETMRIIDGECPIKVWREKRGLSLTKLADAAGLNVRDFSEIESGGSVSPSIFHKICSALDVLPEQLRTVVAAP